MLLATTIATVPPSHAGGIADTSDIVAPSHLFRIAGDHFSAASRLLNIGGPSSIPTATLTSCVLEQVAAGVRVLASALVPTTPNYERLIATAATVDATSATRLLTQYRDAVRPLGTGPLFCARVPESALATLEAARRMLVATATLLP